MQAGVASPARTVYCPGHFRLGNQTFKCWRPGGHGTMNVRTALQESCDTYFYTVARDMGIAPLSAMAHRFGISEKTGLDLLGEKTGIMPDPDWKRARYDMPWVPGDTINTSIGQGYTLTSPAQLAVMAARLASGKQVTLRLHGDDQPDFPPLDVSQAHLEVVLEGMRMVTMEPRGTAFGSRITEPGMAYAGKTGTAQVRRITKRGVDQNTIPWEQRHHGLFVGYAPVQQPRYAVSVVIEHGGGGSSAAAPVARDVLLKVQQLAEARRHQS